MSELPLKMGDKVYYATVYWIGSSATAAEDDDGAPQLSDYDEGVIVETRDKLPNGAKTRHRYRVSFPKRGVLFWMDGRFLVTGKELGPSLPCAYCGKLTRLSCDNCEETVCLNCMKKVGDCGLCKRE